MLAHSFRSSRQVFLRENNSSTWTRVCAGSNKVRTPIDRARVRMRASVRASVRASLQHHGTRRQLQLATGRLQRYKSPKKHSKVLTVHLQPQSPERTTRNHSQSVLALFDLAQTRVYVDEGGNELEKTSRQTNLSVQLKSIHVVFGRSGRAVYCNHGSP